MINRTVISPGRALSERRVPDHHGWQWSKDRGCRVEDRTPPGYAERAGCSVPPCSSRRSHHSQHHQRQHPKHSSSANWWNIPTVNTAEYNQSANYSCRHIVQQIPVVIKEIFVWIVGPRCSVSYFNPLIPTVAIWVQHSVVQDWASECPDVKITNDGLTRSDTGCFIAVPIWQQWSSKG